MKRKMVMAVSTAMIISMAGVTGCGTKTSSTGSTQTQSAVADETNTSDDTSEDENSAIFAEMAKYSYSFSSGAGAWSTELTVKEDGSFEGMYHDTDAGDTGDDYPDGTVYTCNFTGKFATPEKVDEYTYKTKIESISYDKEEGKEELADGRKYVSSTAYGLDDAKDIYIYVKGASISSLPEEYLDWVRSAIDDTDTTLPFYGIYNENAKTGFSGYSESDSTERTSAIDAELAQVQAQADELSDKLENEADTQDDMNTLSSEIYKLWDDELNSIWAQLKNTLDTDTMSSLTSQEKTWIKDRDTQMKEAGEEYEGGSLQSMAMSNKGAQLTRTRVYQLADYLR